MMHVVLLLALFGFIGLSIMAFVWGIAEYLDRNKAARKLGFLFKRSEIESWFENH